MFSAKEYFQEIAKPTAEEFYSNRACVRRAMLACMTMLHVLDYIALNRACGDTKKAEEELRALKYAAAQNGFFQAIEGYGLAAKHCTVARGNAKDLNSKMQTYRPPSFAGVMECGVSFLGDLTGGLTVDFPNGRHYNLVDSLRATEEFYFKSFENELL